jgi:hypothetical protein
VSGSRLLVIVVAEDLIWADRLSRLLEEAGAVPVRARDTATFERHLPNAAGVVVDLTALRLDPLAALARARDAGVRALAVGQHDDHGLRKRALAAGAERVYAYRKLYEDGPPTIARWLAVAPTSA